MDEDGNKKLNLEEFKQGLEESGLELSDDEINNVFQKFDTDNDGNVSVDEFLVGLRVGFFKIYNLFRFYFNVCCFFFILFGRKNAISR